MAFVKVHIGEYPSPPTGPALLCKKKKRSLPWANREWLSKYENKIRANNKSICHRRSIVSRSQMEGSPSLTIFLPNLYIYWVLCSESNGDVIGERSLRTGFQSHTSKWRLVSWFVVNFVICNEDRWWFQSCCWTDCVEIWNDLKVCFVFMCTVSVSLFPIH